MASSQGGRGNTRNCAIMRVLGGLKKGQPYLSVAVSGFPLRGKFPRHCHNKHMELKLKTQMSLEKVAWNACVALHNIFHKLDPMVLKYPQAEVEFKRQN